MPGIHQLWVILAIHISEIVVNVFSLVCIHNERCNPNIIDVYYGQMDLYHLISIYSLPQFWLLFLSFSL